MGTYGSTGNKEPAEGQPISLEQLHADGMSPMQIYYLRLLERTLSLKTGYGDEPRLGPWLLRAINNAAYSAYRSCVEQGVEAEAKALVERQRQSE